jgi:hypothetical protein
MSARVLSDIFDSQVISSSEQFENGGLVLHTARATDAQFISGLDTPIWQQIGIASRPAKPTKAGAAEAFVIVFGSQDQAIASRDLRCSLPAGLEPGETVVYAGGPNNTGTGEIRLSDDGAAEIVIRTRKGNTAGGSEVSISVGSDAVITINAGQRGRIRITETAIELGDSATLSAALAEPLSTFLSNLLLSLAAGTAGGNPLVFATPPLPSVPEIASSVVKLTP